MVVPLRIYHIYREKREPDSFWLIPRARCRRVLSLLATAINIVTASLSPPHRHSSFRVPVYVIYAYTFRNIPRKNKMSPHLYLRTPCVQSDFFRFFHFKNFAVVTKRSQI